MASLVCRFAFHAVACPGVASPDELHGCCGRAFRSAHDVADFMTCLMAEPAQRPPDIARTDDSYPHQLAPEIGIG
jgi:hypothetical protein